VSAPAPSFPWEGGRKGSVALCVSSLMYTARGLGLGKTVVIDRKLHRQMGSTGSRWVAGLTLPAQGEQTG